MPLDLNTIVPQFSTVILDPRTGQIDPVWYQFLLQLFNRSEVVKNAVTDVTGTAPIVSSGGTTPAISISPATPGAAGSMSAVDKTKLDSVTSGAAVSTVGGTSPIISTGGTAPVISISAASGAAAGSMSAADKTKLDSMTAGAAVATVGGTTPIVSSGGTTPVISISPATGAGAGSMSAVDKTKLDSMTSGAAVASVSGTAPIVSSGGTTPAISISPATGAAAGSLSAADKAKLDLLTYATGNWTPVLTFATPGNLAVAYTVQTGHYTQIGRKVSIDFQIVTSSFTWTTSSGNLRITGLPFAANNTVAEFTGVLSWSGIAVTGFMAINPSIFTPNFSLIELIVSGDNKPRVKLGTGNAPSGNSFVLVGSLEYFV